MWKGLLWFGFPPQNGRDVQLSCGLAPVPPGTVCDSPHSLSDKPENRDYRMGKHVTNSSPILPFHNRIDNRQMIEGRMAVNKVRKQQSVFQSRRDRYVQQAHTVCSYHIHSYQAKHSVFTFKSVEWSAAKWRVFMLYVVVEEGGVSFGEVSRW